MVPVLSTTFMMANIVIAISVPLIMMIAIKRQYKADISSFVLGCAIFFIFVQGLEQALHGVILGLSPLGPTIQGNIWLYALYGGLAAGLFEETGRLYCMRFFMKNKYENPYNAVMYGAGHGGFEAVMVLGMGMFMNSVYANLINTGQTAEMMATLDPEGQASFQEVIDALVNTSPYVYLAAPVERLSAMVFHIAASVIVWTGVTKGLKWAYPLAIGLHMGLDAIAVIINGVGAPIVVTELSIIVFVAVVVWFTKKYIWDKYLAEDAESVIPKTLNYSARSGLKRSAKVEDKKDSENDSKAETTEEAKEAGNKEENKDENKDEKNNGGE